MSAVKNIVILLMLFVSLPVFAADFFCPQVVVLPAALQIKDDVNITAKVAKVQDYLTNLRRIRDGYVKSRSSGRRNQIANCLMDHLVTLDNGQALLQPVSEADAATLELLREEAVVVLNVFARDLRHKPELPYILRWVEVKLASR